MRQLKLKSIIQSEVSQKEKDKQYIYGVQKDGNDDLICKAARDTDVKTDFWTLWEKARVG